MNENKKTDGTMNKNKDLSKETMAGSLKEVLSSRDKTKKIAGTILFAVPIIIVFVFFGLPNDHSFSGGANAANVNGTLISLKDFSFEENRIQKMQEYYAQMFGQPFTFDPERQKMIRRQAAESLVQQELLAQAADSENFFISDKEVLEQIKEMNEFKKDGVFQSSYYFQLLEANGFTPAAFEKKIRKQVQGIRTRQVFEVASKPSNRELAKTKELKSTQWNVQFVKLNKDEVAKKVKISSEEIAKSLSADDFVKRAKSYFEANKSKYAEKDKAADFEKVKQTVASELLARDQYDILVKPIEESLKNADMAGLQMNLGKLGLSWEETGWFNLDNTMIPKLSEKELKNAVFQLSANKKMSGLISIRDSKYILNLKDSKVETTAEGKNDFKMMAQQKANQYQEDWVQFFRKDSKVEINPNILQ